MRFFMALLQQAAVLCIHKPDDIEVYGAAMQAGLQTCCALPICRRTLSSCSTYSTTTCSMQRFLIMPCRQSCQDKMQFRSLQQVSNSTSATAASCQLGH